MAKHCFHVVTRYADDPRDDTLCCFCGAAERSLAVDLTKATGHGTYLPVWLLPWIVTLRTDEECPQDQSPRLPRLISCIVGETCGHDHGIA